MLILVGYDINTETPKGRKRLRQVAQTCEDYGQRVQFSLFECKVDEVQYERLRTELLDILNDNEDSLRIYHLHGSHESCVEAYGRDKYQDFDAPLFA